MDTVTNCVDTGKRFEVQFSPKRFCLLEMQWRKSEAGKDFLPLSLSSPHISRINEQSCFFLFVQQQRRKLIKLLWHAGLESTVHRNSASFVQGETDVFQSQILGVRSPSNTDQQDIALHLQDQHQICLTTSWSAQESPGFPVNSFTTVGFLPGHIARCVRFNLSLAFLLSCWCKLQFVSNT